MQFEKIVAPTLKDLFVQQLQEKILSGEIPIGTTLPSERDLAEQMQVSRAVINGGLEELVKRGFLEIQPRKSTIVADYRRNGNMNTLIAIMDFHGGHMGNDEITSILELRRALEHLAVEHAIKHASDEDIDTLNPLLNHLAQSKDTHSAAVAAFEFQHELAYIGKNRILPLIYYSFKAPVITLWSRYVELYGIEELCRNSETLYQYICDRDLEHASLWIDEYLSKVINGNNPIFY